MAAFAVAHLREVTMGPEILEYLSRIDETLQPHEGVFRVHGAEPQMLEGVWQGNLIVIEFPDLRRARAWYDSDSYQRILHLRTSNSVGEAILVEGVEPGYRAAAVVEKALQHGHNSSSATAESSERP